MDKFKKTLKRVLAGIAAVLLLGIVGMILKFYILSPKSRPAPVMAALSQFTLPRYSGARNNESAPKDFMKLPLTMLNRINQNTSNT